MRDDASYSWGPDAPVRETAGRPVKARLRLPRHRYRKVSRDAVLRFEREGTGGLLPFRLFAALLLAAFALMPPVALYAFSDGRILSALLALPVFTVFPWYPGLWMMAYTLGEATGSWRWIEVDGDRGALRARRDGYLLLGHRTFTWPDRQLTSVTLDRRRDTPGPDPVVRIEIGYEGRDLPLLGGERSRSFALRREDPVDRDRFLALAFEVARALGWSGWRMERDDHLEMEIRLLRSADSARPVPQDRGGEPARRGGDAPSGAPGTDVPPFEPSRLDGSGYEVAAWTPGQRVAVVKPGLRGARLAFAAIAGTLLLNLPVLAAGAALVTGAAEVGPFWRLAVAGLFLVVTVLYNGFLLTEGRAQRETVFDWEAGTLRVALDGRERTLTLKAVERLDVRGIEHVATGSDGPSRSYGCEVHVRTAEGEALVLETGSGPTRDAAYLTAAGFAEDVAGALGVDWTWRRWRQRTLWDAVRRLIEQVEARL